MNLVTFINILAFETKTAKVQRCWHELVDFGNDRPVNIIIHSVVIIYLKIKTSSDAQFYGFQLYQVMRTRFKYFFYFAYLYLFFYEKIKDFIYQKSPISVYCLGVH